MKSGHSKEANAKILKTYMIHTFFPRESIWNKEQKKIEGLVIIVKCDLAFTFAFREKLMPGKDKVKMRAGFDLA